MNKGSAFKVLQSNDGITLVHFQRVECTKHDAMHVCPPIAERSFPTEVFTLTVKLRCMNLFGIAGTPEDPDITGGTGIKIRNPLISTLNYGKTYTSTVDRK